MSATTDETSITLALDQLGRVIDELEAEAPGVETAADVAGLFIGLSAARVRLHRLERDVIAGCDSETALAVHDLLPDGSDT